MKKARKGKSAPVASAEISAITTISSTTPVLSVGKLVDASHTETQLSPIDQFIENSNHLNLLYLRPDVDNPPRMLPVEPLLSRLILLGYLSAVEGYVRSLIRCLVNVDEVARKHAQEKTVSFGAALHHSRDLLPEALMEGTSLADSSNIKKTLANVTGIGIEGGLTGGVVDEFDKLCELRHCCVHRFGRFGSKNALELGVLESPELLEKPIVLDAAALQDIAEVARTFVKSINNVVCSSVLLRTLPVASSPKGKPTLHFTHDVQWSWHFGRDRRRFQRYYDVFATKMDAVPSLGIRELYDRFRNLYRLRGART